MKKLIHYFTGAFILLCFLFNINLAYAQKAVKVSVDQVCKCLEVKDNESSPAMTPKEIFDICAGEVMATNRPELSKTFDLGTVEGIIQLRNHLVEKLNKDCAKFREMFVDNKNN